MNIEKIVAACLDRRRSESSNNKKEYKSMSNVTATNACYEL